MANFIDERFYSCECGSQEFYESPVVVLLKEAKGVEVSDRVKPLEVSTKYAYSCVKCGEKLKRG